MVKAEEIMRRNAITMDKNKGFKGALEIMLNTKTDYILITENKKPVGIITERDILKTLVKHMKSTPKIKIENVMTEELIKIDPNTDMDYMSEVMQEESIRHLPVTKENKLVGMVTSYDIVKETSDIHGKNIVFTKWQNIQTAIIVAFFLFVIAYIILRFFVL